MNKLPKMWSFILIVTSGISLNCGETYDTKEGKLLLKPVELVDLITEEKTKTGISETQFRTPLFTDDTIQVLNLEEDTTTEQECRDEETLRGRKVWSRWSKWGDCSVTCGPGVISRQRACLAGRCARGEREEQRRPCVRAPCLHLSPAEEFRDVD